MVDLTKDEQEDFEVYSSLGTATEDFVQAFASLRKSLRPADTKSRTGAAESHDDILIRLALSTINSGIVLYRKNDSAEDIKIQAWLSIVSEKAKATLVEHQTPAYRKSLSEDDLRDIAKLSLNFDNTQMIVGILAERYGIVLIVEQGFRAMKMDGCVFTLKQGTPVIGISVRYNRYDNFWFTLMHELAHICFHYEQLDQPILDDLEHPGVDGISDMEIEANILAKNSLVRRQIWRLIRNAQDDEEQFLVLCKKAEVHPAIAAGMLRHETRNYTLYSKYQNVMDVRKAFGIADV